MKKKRLKIYVEILFIIVTTLRMFHEVAGRFYVSLSEPDEAVAPLSVLPINWVRYCYTGIPLVYVISAKSLAQTRYAE